MHLDINSCFASIEQLYNRKLIGKPVAVAAYTADRGCILAASREAKTCGVKTGLRVIDGRRLCPRLVVLPADPPKYRRVHHKLKKILENYHEAPIAKSIDEFVLDLKGYPAYRAGMEKTAREIKARIKHEIGACLTVSIGIAPNRYLAKVVSDLEKPDGLVKIDKSNFQEFFGRLKLIDLCGIKVRNAYRLQKIGVHSVLDFYQTPVSRLRAAFHGVVGYYWWLRLHGFEIDAVQNEQKSFGAQYVFPKPTNNLQEIFAIMQKLVEKMGWHLRSAGKQARGLYLAVSYSDHTWWHQGKKLENFLFSSRDIFEKTRALFFTFPRRPVREIAVSCFNVNSIDNLQYQLFNNIEKKHRLTETLDKINHKFGENMISPANLLICPEAVPDRIAFGK